MSGHTRENPRDAEGWMIPRRGTVSEEIYDLLRDGHTPHEIAELLGKPLNHINQIVWRIRNGNRGRM